MESRTNYVEFGSETPICPNVSAQRCATDFGTSDQNRVDDKLRFDVASKYNDLARGDHHANKAEILMRVFGITGWKNSGKTTLMERLVAEFCGRGFSVSTIKHAHHNVDVDQPGKDSHRHRQAGAHQVILASSMRWALMHEVRDAQEPPLSELLEHLEPVDLVLIEGYKAEEHAKIEAALSPSQKPLLVHKDSKILAVASGYSPTSLEVPTLDINDISTIADFIATKTGLPS